MHYKPMVSGMRFLNYLHCRYRELFVSTYWAVNNASWPSSAKLNTRNAVSLILGRRYLKCAIGIQRLVSSD
jgi:hypothetical protein